MPKMLKK